jgi:hypothetical protein
MLFGLHLPLLRADNKNNEEEKEERIRVLQF